MRYSLSVLGFMLFGCTTATAPDSVRQLAEIAGYNNNDPQVVIEPVGRNVNVSVTSYGNGCYTQGDTDVVVNGLEATVTPHDYVAPPGSNCTDILMTFVHRTSLQFDGSGTAQIRIRGIDAGTRSTTKPVGDTLIVVRSVELF